MRRVTILAILLVVFALLPVRPVAAKGAFDRVTISGPGLTGELEVTAAMLHLPVIDNLEDDRSPVAPPVNPSAGYDLIRYYGFRAFDHVRYYPDWQGGRGAVYYVGIVNGAGPDDGRWFLATEAGECAATSARRAWRTTGAISAAAGHGRGAPRRCLPIACERAPRYRSALPRRAAIPGERNTPV